VAPPPSVSAVGGTLLDFATFASLLLTSRFQRRISLKLIAEQLLLASPAYSEKDTLPLFIRGEVLEFPLAIPDGVRLYASGSNTGALDAARELQTQYSVCVTTSIPASIKEHIAASAQQRVGAARRRSNTFLRELLQRAPSSRHHSADAQQRVGAARRRSSTFLRELLQRAWYVPGMYLDIAQERAVPPRESCCAAERKRSRKVPPPGVALSAASRELPPKELLPK
jgi:hypothetical protein